ncbi:N-acetyltransferase [bacterium]|nr:N-acetyltransferase [bacterium]
MTASDAPRIDLPALETARLRLRGFRTDDARDVFEYSSDPEVTRFVFWSPHATVQESSDFVNRHVQLAGNGELSSWAVEHKADDKLIGTCGFTWWRPEHGKAELAYALSRTYWNQGLVTEAAAACIAYGFDALKLNRIEARCMPENIASERVMQKCGMRYEGTMRQTMMVKGRYVDLKLYAILCGEWKGRDDGN